MQKYLLKNPGMVPQLAIVSHHELLAYLDRCSDADLKVVEWWRLEEVDGGRNRFTPPPPYAAFSIPDSEVECG